MSISWRLKIDDDRFLYVACSTVSILSESQLAVDEGRCCVHLINFSGLVDFSLDFFELIGIFWILLVNVESLGRCRDDVWIYESCCTSEVVEASCSIVLYLKSYRFPMAKYRMLCAWSANCIHMYYFLPEPALRLARVYLSGPQLTDLRCIFYKDCGHHSHVVNLSCRAHLTWICYGRIRDGDSMLRCATSMYHIGPVHNLAYAYLCTHYATGWCV